MPYIEQTYRERLLSTPAATTPGELNYLFTMTINRYVTKNGCNYAVFNDVLGALEGAKLEFYRRVVVPYEDEKRKANGDVY